VTGLRIGLLQQGFEGCEADVADTVRKAACSLCQYGVSVRDLSFPWHKQGITHAFLLPGLDYTFINTNASIKNKASCRFSTVDAWAIMFAISLFYVRDIRLLAFLVASSIFICCPCRIASLQPLLSKINTL
jgi:hypothetical protein